MTDLTKTANALHSKIWPLVGQQIAERSDGDVATENALMNAAVARYAPLLLETPTEILGLIWGVHPDEAVKWREDIRATLAAAGSDPFDAFVEADSAPRAPVKLTPYPVIRQRDIARGCTPRTREEYAADCRARGNSEDAIAEALEG
jgi:hypothetical protein